MSGVKCHDTECTKNRGQISVREEILRDWRKSCPGYNVARKQSKGVEEKASK